MFTEDVVKGSLFRLYFSFNLSCWSEMKAKHIFLAQLLSLICGATTGSSICYSLLYTCDAS